MDIVLGPLNLALLWRRWLPIAGLAIPIANLVMAIWHWERAGINPAPTFPKFLVGEGFIPSLSRALPTPRR